MESATIYQKGSISIDRNFFYDELLKQSRLLNHRKNNNHNLFREETIDYALSTQNIHPDDKGRVRLRLIEAGVVEQIVYKNSRVRYKIPDKIPKNLIDLSFKLD